MTSKRVLGFIFIILAVLLTLAIVGQLQTVFGVIIGFFMILTGKLEGYQVGNVIGQIIYWVVHIVATIALWKYGVKWSRKQVKV
jgi:hypothetical protein